MNVKLDPPPVQLPPDTEQRVRARLMSAVTEAPVRPHRRHRWAPALAAAAAVITVVAGGLVAADRFRPAADDTSPSSGGVVSLDAGAPTETERQDALTSCAKPTGRPADRNGWTRRIHRLGTGPQIGIAVAIRASDTFGDWWTCVLFEGQMTSSGFGRVEAPTAERPLVQIGGGSGPVHADPGSSGSSSITQWSLQRVHRSIAWLESRYSWDGGAGPWYRAALTDGVAYTSASAELHGSMAVPRGMRVEYRAFDVDGNPVPLG